LRKATVSFAMTVRLSLRLPVCLSVSLYVRMERLDSHWTNFHEI